MLEYKVKFNQNVKLGNDVHRKGDTATVAEDLCDELVELDVIEEGFEIVTKEPKKVDEMTVPELKEYATEYEIDLGEAKKRDEILVAILDWREMKSAEIE